MAIFTFTQPGDYGSTYFTLETVRNDQGFYDSSSLKNAEGFYSNFDGVVEDHLVTSSYIFSEVIPAGTSSFEFNPLVSGMPTGSFYFRGTGNMTVNVATYSGSYTLTPAQLYGQGILNTFALTPIPDFQSRVAVSGGYYQDIESQNTILNSIGTDLLSSASLVITPNAYKEDFLYSVVPTNGNGDFTVTRATTATLTDANGNVVLEPYNLVQFSEQFENAFWLKLYGSVTSNVTTAPNGTLTADLFTKTSGVNTISQVASLSTTFITTGAHTLSVYVKPNVGNQILLRLDNAGNTANFSFDFTTKTFTNTGANVISSSFDELPNGWFRLKVTGNVISTGWTLTPCMLFSNPIDDSMFIWGVQLVEGTSALPYQPTLDRLDRIRLDYSIGGEPNILLEPQRTNLIVSSSQFDGASWTKFGSSVTANSTTSPSGIADADTLIESATNATHLLEQSVAVTAVNHTLSCYVKAVSGSTRNVGILFNVALKGVLINPSTGAVVTYFNTTAADVTISNVGNGWFRVSVTVLTSAVTEKIRIYLGNGTTWTAPYLGDGTSGVYIWGAQLEAGAYATSYIPTTTATVTRNTDVITRTNVYTNNLITAAGGTWFVELRNNLVLTRDGSTPLGLFINTGTAINAGNGFSIRNGGGTQRFVIFKLIADVQTSIFQTTSDNSKLAIKWNGTSADIFENGVKVVSATSFTPTAMENLICNAGATPYNINSIALYTTPLPDSKCIELTGGGFDTPELAYASIGVTSEAPTYLNQSVNSLIF